MIPENKTTYREAELARASGLTFSDSSPQTHRELPQELQASVSLHLQRQTISTSSRSSSGDTVKRGV